MKTQTDFRKILSSTEGLSLIEIMIALGLMAISLTGLMTATVKLSSVNKKSVLHESFYPTLLGASQLVRDDISCANVLYNQVFDPTIAAGSPVSFTYTGETTPFMREGTESQNRTGVNFTFSKVRLIPMASIGTMDTSNLGNGLRIYAVSLFIEAQKMGAYTGSPVMSNSKIDFKVVIDGTNMIKVCYGVITSQEYQACRINQRNYRAYQPLDAAVPGSPILSACLP